MVVGRKTSISGLSACFRECGKLSRSGSPEESVHSSNRNGVPTSFAIGGLSSVAYREQDAYPEVFGPEVFGVAEDSATMIVIWS